MRIAVKVTVEMTPEQISDYCDFNAVNRAGVREDVRDYIRMSLQDSPAFTQGGADVSVA
jgi:hypothetical protein